MTGIPNLPAEEAVPKIDALRAEIRTLVKRHGLSSPASAMALGLVFVEIARADVLAQNEQASRMTVMSAALALGQDMILCAGDWLESERKG